MLIILSYLAVFPLIEFLLPGQKFISTLLSDILAILGIIWAFQPYFGLFLQLNKYNLLNQLEVFMRYKKLPK
jgi:hypothetical protein